MMIITIMNNSMPLRELTLDAVNGVQSKVRKSKTLDDSPLFAFALENAARSPD